jgi:hypothetical protein
MAIRYKVSEIYVKFKTLIITGLLGVDVLAVFTFLTMNEIDLSVTISLYATAIAIPFLVLLILTSLVEERYKYYVTPWYMNYAEILGTFGSIVALGAIFCHFSWIVALIFVLTCIVAFIFIMLFADEMKKANKNNEA